MGFSSLPSFVSEDPRDATLERYLDHIDHVVQLVGIEHVGLGPRLRRGPRPGLAPAARAALGRREPAGRHRPASRRCCRNGCAREAAALLYLPYAPGIAGLARDAERHRGAAPPRLHRRADVRADPRRQLAAPVRAGLGRVGTGRGRFSPRPGRPRARARGRPRSGRGPSSTLMNWKPRSRWRRAVAPSPSTMPAAIPAALARVDHLLHGRRVLRAAIVRREAEADREVGRSDQDRVDARRRGDRLDVREPVGRLDHHDAGDLAELLRVVAPITSPTRLGPKDRSPSGG